MEEDPQVCPSFGSKHDVVADVRRLSLAHEAPRHPSATFALVLVVPHAVKALQQFCFGHTRAGVAELAGNQNVVAAVEDGSGLVPHEILSRLGGPWQQEGLRLRLLRLRLLRLALLARLPLQVQVNGLARRLRLHGRSVRGGFAAIQPLHQAMLQVRRRVVFTRGLLAGLDEFFKDGQSLLAADAVVGQYLPHVVQGLEHASPHSHGVRKDG